MNISIAKNNCEGFTLIEIVLYIGLFALLLGGVIAASFDFVASNARDETQAMMEEEGNFLLAKYLFIMNEETNIEIPLANSSSTSLSVTLPGDIQANLSLQNGHVIYTSGTRVPATLNNTDTTISGLTFTHVQATSNGFVPESVLISFDLLARTENGRMLDQPFSRTFYFRP